jgi:uncharacterized delta-60 repeat protein
VPLPWRGTTHDDTLGRLQQILELLLLEFRYLFPGGSGMKTQIALATLIGAAMIACTQNAPKTVRTSVLEPIGYGTITFVDDSQGQPTLNLKTKAVLTGYNGGFIQLKRISVNSFTVGVRPSATSVGGYRYVSFTFAVRNASETGVASSAPRSNLTIIPVSVSSGAHATLNSPMITPFSALGRFDGTAASPSIAQDVQPTHGSRFNQFNGLAQVNNDQADLQVFTEATMIGFVSLASTSWPSTHRPFPYGYVVRNKYNPSNRILGANPPEGQFDGLVTFGFKVPLQTTIAQDPFAYSAEFVIASDNAIRVTKSNEESSLTRVQAEATVLGAGLVDAADVCAVRYAGAAGLPTSRYLNGFGVNAPNSGFGAGTLDTCFGPPNGFAKLDLSLYDEGTATVLQPDGKILVAGIVFEIGGDDNFLLARFNANGTPDLSFGTGGKITLDFSGFTDRAYAIVLQPDGKILLAGRTGNALSDDFALARFNANGTIDSSFGTGGKVTLDFFGLQDVARAMALQPDGKIVLAGSAANTLSYDFAVARFNANGTLDLGFGIGGKTRVDFAGLDDFADAMALQPDGKILLAGSSVTADLFPSDFGLTRLNPNGTLDSSFGVGGVTYVDFNSNRDSAYAMALQSDGKILLAGLVRTSGVNDNFGMVRFNANGVLDSSFGTGGKVTYDAGGNNDYANAMALQADGKILLGGQERSAPFPQNSNFELVRFNPNGVPDSSFNNKASFDFGTVNSTDDFISAIAVQPDGRILAVGTAADPNDVSDIALARYNP